MEISEIEAILKEKRMNKNIKTEIIEFIETIPIPENKMGWIIGKNGSYITQVILKLTLNLKFVTIIKYYVLKII